MSLQAVSDYIFSKKEWQTKYSITDYNNKTAHAKGHIVHYLLAHQKPDEDLINFIKTCKNLSLLTKGDGRNEGITPLIMSVMFGREVVAKALLNRWAEQKESPSINMTDNYKWTALHHAAICSSTIFEMLKEHGANLAAKNLGGATPLELRNITSLEVPAESLNSLYLEIEGQLERISIVGKERLEITGLKIYRDIPYIPPSHYRLFWSEVREDVICTSEALTSMLGKELKPSYPPLIIKPCKIIGEGQWELVAKEHIPCGTILSAYAGELVVNKKVNEGHFLFERLDAAQVGNFTRYVNTGFPNCVPIITMVSGLETNYYCISDSKGVAPEEPLLFSYGIRHLLAFDAPCAIFGKEKMHEFFKVGLEQRLKEHEALAVEGQKKGTFKEFILATDVHSKIIYVLGTPAALLDLHFRRIISVKEWLQLLETQEERIVIRTWLEEVQFAQFKAYCFLRSVFRFDQALGRANDAFRQKAFDWILNSIGKYSTLKILKGMDLMIAWNFSNDTWEKLDQKLDSYNPSTDSKAPLNVEQTAQDTAYRLKMFSEKHALASAIGTKAQALDNPDAVTLFDRVIAILSKS